MKFKSIILAATTFALISNLALANSTIRISDDATIIRSHKIEVSDVIKADSATSYQMVSESSLQIGFGEVSPKQKRHLISVLRWSNP